MGKPILLGPGTKPGIKMIEGHGWLLVSPKGLYFPALLRRRFGIGLRKRSVFHVKAGNRSPGKRAAATRKANAQAAAE